MKTYEGISVLPRKKTKNAATPVIQIRNIRNDFQVDFMISPNAGFLNLIFFLTGWTLLDAVKTSNQSSRNIMIAVRAGEGRIECFLEFGHFLSLQRLLEIRTA